MNIPTPTKNIDLWKVFGLSDSEIKIIEAISKYAISAAIISRHTNISETTISYTLKKLLKRNLVKTSKDNNRLNWRSNIPEIIRQIKNLPRLSTPSSKNPTRQ